MFLLLFMMRVDWSQLHLDIEQQFWADDMNIIRVHGFGLGL